MSAPIHAVALIALATACALRDDVSQEVDANVIEARRLSDADDLDAGIEVLRSALPLVPAGEPALRAKIHRWLGHLHTRNGAHGDALMHLETARDLDPDDAWTHYALGVALLQHGSYEEAIASFTGSLRLDPGLVKALQFRGHVRALMERHHEASADFTAALNLLKEAHETRWTLFMRATSLDAIGEHEAAERDRERARGID